MKLKFSLSIVALMALAAAQSLSERLGQSFVIENRSNQEQRVTVRRCSDDGLGGNAAAAGAKLEALIHLGKGVVFQPLRKRL
jgi:hypothetical protein